MPFRLASVIATISLLTGALLLCGGCATTGPQGETSLILIPTAQEVALGASVDASIRQQYAVLPDGDVTAYVNRIGARVAAHSDRRNLEYHFTVLDADIVNAFAAPGGFIYVTTGLLTEARSEAEVAAVIGHEMGHVTARHSVRKLQKTYGAALLADLLLGDDETMGHIAEIATGLLMLKYSRDNEFEADEYGYKYSRAAGYDPREMITFFEALQQLHGSATPSGLEGWLSTHPPTGDRIEKYRLHIQTWGAAGGLEIGAENHRRAIASLRD